MQKHVRVPQRCLRPVAVLTLALAGAVAVPAEPVAAYETTPAYVGRIDAYAREHWNPMQAEVVAAPQHAVVRAAPGSTYTYVEVKASFITTSQLSSACDGGGAYKACSAIAEVHLT